MFNFDFATRFLFSRLFGRSSAVIEPIDVNKECRRLQVLSEFDFYRWFVSDPIANRVVTTYPDATWAMPPKIESRGDADDSPFDKAIREINDKFAMFSNLHRADVVCGIGEFGLITLLFSGDPGKPLARGEKFMGFRCHSQREVHISESDSNTKSTRYGLPVMYQVGPRSSPSEGAFVQTPGVASVQATAPQKVHWTRCIHLVETPVTNQVFGVPRQLPVHAQIQDIQKILGGSSQALWNQGFPSFSLEIDPDKADIDLEDTETQGKLQARFKKFVESFERMLAVTGGEVKSHQQQAQPPKEHFEVQLTAVSIATKIPMRILTGADDGKLAGDQSKGQFRTNVVARQTLFATPHIVRPVVDALIATGTVPEPEEGYDVVWGDLDNMTEVEKADVATKFTDALAKYAVANIEAVFPFEEYLIYIWDIAPEVAAKLAEKARDQVRLTHDPNDVEPTVPQDGQPVEGSGLAHRGGAGADPQVGRT